MRYITLISFFIAQNLLGQDNIVPSPKLIPANESIEFVKNLGQWEENIQFKSDLPGGKLYFESSRLTYVFYSREDMSRIHEIHHGQVQVESENDLIIDAHLFQISFPGSNDKVKFEGKKIKSNYNNYFLGKNRKYWASKVPIYNEAYAKNIWPGIDYRVYSNELDLKYDFLIRPGVDPGQIKMSFDYLDKVWLKYGNLHLKTSVNEMIDLKPVAYQIGLSGLENIACNYILKENIVTFDFPEGYDKNKMIIIDPQLVFSSYTGASQDNWGFTATFDENGNLYGGGAVFNDTNKSYPTTPGAFQVNQLIGGAIDIGITKFSSDGTSLLYSTYLGGTKNELPHSLVVDDNNDLIVMGTTSSPDFPVTTGAYDTTYNISGNATMYMASKTFLGSDIFIAKFSASGANLIGSTYMGGSGFDGLNRYNNTPAVSQLCYNYGDDVRGEVFTDKTGNIYVASTTHSTNFPVTNSSTHQGGVQDAVVFKMNSTLSSLIWSTYLGGNGNDAAYSVQVDNAGKVYVAGGTASSNFPTTSGALHPSPLGGIDGFVTIYNPSGTSILNSTRLGTSGYDQAYFVQLDDSNNVFVTGQTTGNYLVTPSSVYSNPFSGQFIHKLNPTLSSTIFSTVIGRGGSSGNVKVDISPSAFLVNQCNHIYLAGWGGTINSGNSQATNSTTNGLPTTPGSFKPTTDGNDFYLIVLDVDADSMLYATFFGGNSGSGEHVDGGTSRFDKKGIVYQAVCAGCGGNNAFPTSPSNVWAKNNGSFNCNLGVIKFDLSQLSSDIGLSAITKVCIPGNVLFNNTSNGGNTFYWDFGDGNTSTLFQPNHTYIDTGDFTVMLVVADSLSCIIFDTSYITIRGEAPPVASIDTVPVLCPGDSVQLQAHGGTKYKWFPPTGLSNDTIPNPVTTPTTNKTYIVIVGDSCGSDPLNLIYYDTSFVDLTLAQNLTSASPADTVCKGESLLLTASGGANYNWIPPTYLNKSTVANPVATPLQSIIYTVQITDQYNCLWTRKVNLHVEDSLNPGIISHADTTICIGDTIELFSIGGNTYAWKPTKYLSDSLSDKPIVWPDKNMDFIVSISSKCFKTTDTVHVNVNDFITHAMQDTFACAEVPIKLRANPGTTFKWQPEELIDSGNTNTPIVVITGKTIFTVLATDSIGCQDVDSVVVDLRNPPYVSAGNDQVISKNGTQLEAAGKGKFHWEPESYLSCPDCPFTNVDMPKGSILFTLTLTDIYGCTNIDNVLITRIENDLFVPNSFTPNSDLVNDVFKPFGYDLTNYKLTIYNRWGQIVFVSFDLEEGWNGYYDGEESENGVYVWEITYTQNGGEKTIKGTVSLVR